MPSSSPVVTQPVTFPERFAWLQHTVQTHVRPFHLVMGAVIGLVTVLFLGLTLVLLLIATNFNLLGWVE